MADTKTIYTQAQLALAAYGNFQIGQSPDAAELQTQGMGSNQATAFAGQWQVVDQYNDNK
jgi:hypothetical protein